MNWYLRTAINTAFLTCISLYLIIDNGLAIFQDINDLIQTSVYYQNLQQNEQRANQKLQVLITAKDQGLEGYLRETLQPYTKYIESMCTCGKYRERFCQPIDDLIVPDMVQMIKSDTIFIEELDTLKLNGETERQYERGLDFEIGEFQKGIASNKIQQKDLTTKAKKTISYIIVLSMILLTEALWFFIGPKRYLRPLLIAMLVIYIFLFYTMSLNRFSIERGRVESNIKHSFHLINHLLFVVYLSLFRQKSSNLIAARPSSNKLDLDDETVRLWCAKGLKDKLRRYLTENWHEIDINKVKEHSTPLLIAIKNRHFSVVKILFTIYGDTLDTGFRDENGHNALDIAVQQRNIDIFNLLLKQSTVTHISSLILAVKNDEVKMVRDLISKVPRGKIIDVIKPLTEFCEIVDRLKSKNLPKNRQREADKNRNKLKKSLLERLGNESVTSEADFVCPGCQMVMKAPLKIYSCTSDHHLFCSGCLENGRILKCLNDLCLEDFTINIPHRRLTSERLAACIIGTN